MMKPRYLAAGFWIAFAALGVVCGLRGAFASPTVEDNAVRFHQIASASLPAAASSNKAGVYYDSTSNILRYSNGSTWRFWSDHFTTVCFQSPCAEDNTALFAGGVHATGAWVTNKVTCSFGQAGATGGGSDVIVIALRDVTAGSDLCSCTLGSATCGQTGTPRSCTCSGTMTIDHLYTTYLTSGTLCGTDPGQIVCNVEAIQ